MQCTGEVRGKEVRGANKSSNPGANLGTSTCSSTPGYIGVPVVPVVRGRVPAIKPVMAYWYTYK